MVITGSMDGCAGLKIAMIAACPFPHPRGTPVRIHRMSSALARRGHDVHVFTYHLGDPLVADTLSIHRIPRVRTYNHYSPGPTYQKLLVVDPLLVWTLFRGLLRETFHVIHAHHYEGLLVARLARIGRRIPVVYDAHTLLGSELPHYQLGLSRRVVCGIGQRLDRWLPRLSDHVVSVTESIKDHLLVDGMRRDAVTVITNGVEHELFQEAAPQEGVPSSRTLVFTGNLASYQGIDYMLRSFARVLGQRQDVRLLVVTESSFEPYEPLAAELGVRHAIDLSAAPFERHPTILAGAAIALNPRVQCDGIPQKLLNYMAAGCATISFEGSAPCVEHGRTGWTVPSADVEAFAAGIVKLLDDVELARKLGRNARATVLQHYTWDATAEQSEALYRRLLGQRVAVPERA